MSEAVESTVDKAVKSNLHWIASIAVATAGLVMSYYTLSSKIDIINEKLTVVANLQAQVKSLNDKVITLEAIHPEVRK